MVQIETFNLQNEKTSGITILKTEICKNRRIMHNIRR